jgi:hypothetical protein
MNLVERQAQMKNKHETLEKHKKRKMPSPAILINSWGKIKRPPEISSRTWYTLDDKLKLKTMEDVLRKRQLLAESIQRQNIDLPLIFLRKSAKSI